MNFIDLVSTCIGTIGVLVIIYGSLISFWKLVQRERSQLLEKITVKNPQSLRHNYSFYLLMGLEYLIGADIIRTLVRPTLQELAVLGAMVAIRTVTSYFLNKEMSARMEK